ncbi:MAG: hypothetical protein L6R30_12080 [Thermoanaerobaculia bacterium]|nr:hypothetical protein [Thermoanaerobaculia bacterium]
MVTRTAAYLWASPVTLAGLFLAGIAVASRGQARSVEGVLEVHGGLVGRLLGQAGGERLVIYAITFGHVVLGESALSLERTRRHERVHVRQYERLGLFFPFFYFASSAWAWLSGKDPYFENTFEKEAFEAEREPDGGV